MLSCGQTIVYLLIELSCFFHTLFHNHSVFGIPWVFPNLVGVTRLCCALSSTSLLRCKRIIRKESANFTFTCIGNYSDVVMGTQSIDDTINYHLNNKFWSKRCTRCDNKYPLNISKNIHSTLLSFVCNGFSTDFLVLIFFLNFCLMWIHFFLQVFLSFIDSIDRTTVKRDFNSKTNSFKPL